MNLASPWFLLLVLLIPVGLYLRRRGGEPALLFAPGRFLEGMPKTLRVRLLPVPKLLRVLGLLLAVTALARPVTSVAIPLPKEGINILLCLDISSSMATNDLDPKKTRLDLAREAALTFIEGRPDDRIGLLCFARYPDLRCPLTRDHDALGAFLSAVTMVAYDGPEDATGIGTAVARSAGLLSDGSDRSRVVILLTDGEENVATVDKPDEIAPIHAGQLCETLGVRVYAISVGLGNRSSSGEWIPIDTMPVERLAARTGGRFYTARDATAIAGVYGAIDVLEKVKTAEPRFRTEERFLPFLIAALGLFVFARLLERTVLKVLP